MLRDPQKHFSYNRKVAMKTRDLVAPENETVTPAIAEAQSRTQPADTFQKKIPSQRPPRNFFAPSAVKCFLLAPIKTARAVAAPLLAAFLFGTLALLTACNATPPT